MNECTNCEAGQYSATKNTAACEPCEAGKYQMETGKPFCREVKFGSTLVAHKNEASGVVSYEQRTCPKVGVECTGKRLEYDGGVWHNPVSGLQLQ
jgi:hypothetical protein